jgi:outer membrane protein OmpA-like peptidoglycan-associated protein
MEEQSSSDHISSSLTDLMTSLMVIFILLLLVFIRSAGSRDKAMTDLLLKTLREGFKSEGFNANTIKPDPRDPSAILVIVPERLMNFEIGRSALRPEGENFLKTYIPKLASVLCAPQIQPSVESIVVEGHTDRAGYSGRTAEENQNLNLKLSQDRSMEVVKNALSDLSMQSNERACFFEKLSASGRGEQDQQDTPEESRRVILKIRVKVKDLKPIKVSLQ